MPKLEDVVKSTSNLTLRATKYTAKVVFYACLKTGGYSAGGIGALCGVLVGAMLPSEMKRIYGDDANLLVTYVVPYLLATALVCASGVVLWATHEYKFNEENDTSPQQPQSQQPQIRR